MWLPTACEESSMQAWDHQCMVLSSKNVCLAQIRPPKRLPLEKNLQEHTSTYR